jgi:tetratricopeptide (TPR) repeat protein
MSAHPSSVSTAYDEGLRLSAQGRHVEAIGCYEQALVANGQDTRTLFALGNTAKILGMPGPAEEFFRQVLNLEPERIEALVNLANLMRSTGQMEAAKALLEPALARQPECAELWLTLGSTIREMGDARTAAEHYREALKFKPDYPQALGNLADIVADDGDLDTALDLYDRALKSDPGNAQARLNRAVLHLLRGNLKDGWRDYAARLKVPNKVPVATHGLAKWTGGTLKRTRLLVTAEQGVGDQIMFASSFADLCARAASDGGHIILESEPRLVSLFARSFPSATVKAWDVETKGGETIARYDWLKAAGGANAAIEMGTLPRYLRRTLDSFPPVSGYLKPDMGQKILWQGALANLGSGPTIGICWRSGKSGGGRNLQYAPLETWGAFLRDCPGTLVCTQYDATPEEVGLLELMSGRDILVPDGIDQKNELDRTASLLAALDCVVSAPTAVSWLASSVGTPTFKILYDTSWTSFGQTHEPFAPDCRCMMPATRGDWPDVFAKTKDAIARL